MKESGTHLLTFCYTDMIFVKKESFVLLENLYVCMYVCMYIYMYVCM